MDITYGVEISYLSSGNLNLPTAGIDKAAASIKGLTTAASTSMGGLLSATSHLASGANAIINGAIMGGMAVAAASAFAIVKTGLLEMNAEVEQMAIGMAAMFSAHGNVSDFNAGLGAGAELIQIMRRDARELPGEFKDLAKITSTMATPALNAGMSIRETEALAANAMASGMTHGIDPAVIGREMASIIAGSARSNMPMLTRGMLNLQTDAKGLNAMSMDKRLVTINKALGLGGGPEAEAMAAMKKAHMASWIGLSSTIKDQVKQILGTLSQHLFERLKGAMGFVSNWLTTHGPEITRWADSVGTKLAEGFTYAFHQLSRLEPLLAKLGGFLGKQADQGKLGRDLGMVAGGAAAIKLGTAVAPAAISGVGTLAGAGAAEGGMFAALGLGVIETGGALAVVLGAVALAMTAVYGVFEGLGNVLSPLHDGLERTYQLIGHYFTQAIESIGRSWTIVQPAFNRFAEFLGGALLTTVEIAVESFAKFALAIESLLTTIANSPLIQTALALLKGAAESVAPGGAALLDPDAKRNKHREVDFVSRYGPDLDKKVASHQPPNHTTNIHKVEIKVNSNQDPSRIARKVVNLLKDETLKPRGAVINMGNSFSTQRGL
jgi:hypothetical protein